MAAKDFWDKFNIIAGTLLLPAAIGLAGYLISLEDLCIKTDSLLLEKRVSESKLKQAQVELINSYYIKDLNDNQRKKLNFALLEYALDPENSANRGKELLAFVQDVLNIKITKEDALEIESAIENLPLSVTLREGDTVLSRDKKVKIFIVDVAGHGATANFLIGEDFHSITKDDIQKPIKSKDGSHTVTIDHIFAKETKMLTLTIQKN